MISETESRLSQVYDPSTTNANQQGKSSQSDNKTTRDNIRSTTSQEAPGTQGGNENSSGGGWRQSSVNSSYSVSKGLYSVKYHY